MSLTRQSVTALAAAVANGEVTAAEVVGAHLDRAEKLQDDLNAFTMIDRAGAAAAATGQRTGPLPGVPVAVKDLIDQAGLPTTAGSSFHREVATATAPAVARLEAAGAVMIGRTGLHEFAFGFSSENHWWGPVRNPWDPATSPGGSSGGSAAAVAAGLVAAALGTDTGGSVRVPAALCGIVGLKVTHGRVPTRGVFPLAPSLDTVGPLARDVAGVAALYRAMAGDDPADPWSAPRAVDPPREVALDGLRVAVPVPWTSVALDATQAAGFASALDALADAGAEVSEVPLDVEAYPGRVSASFAPEVAAVHRRWFPARAGEYGPDVRERLAAVFDVPADHHETARRWRAALRHALDRALAGAAVLATPTVAALRKVIGEDTVTVGAKEMPYRPELSRFTAPVNHAGHPALALPVGPPGDGTPPASLQLVGRRWDEEGLLAIGAALEAAGISVFHAPPIW